MEFLNDKDLMAELRTKPFVRPEIEASLFARADELLAARREKIADRATRAARARKQRRGVTEAMARGVRAATESILSARPAAGIATMAAMILIVVFSQRNGSEGHLVEAKLPEHPRNNPYPALYDAQWREERTAYEREVLREQRKMEPAD